MKHRPEGNPRRDAAICLVSMAGTFGLNAWILATTPLTLVEQVSQGVLLAMGLFLLGLAWGAFTRNLTPPTRLFSSQFDDWLSSEDLRLAEHTYAVLCGLLSVWVALKLWTLEYGGFQRVRIPILVVFMHRLAGPIAAALVIPLGALWLLMMWRLTPYSRRFNRTTGD